MVESDVSGRGGFSTTYGINGRSILSQLPFFDVTKCLPYDIMHSLFEGVGPHTLNCLFKHLINNGFVDLSTINKSISELCIGLSEKSSLPSTIFHDSGTFRFKQKGNN